MQINIPQCNRIFQCCRYLYHNSYTHELERDLLTSVIASVWTVIRSSTLCNHHVQMHRLKSILNTHAHFMFSPFYDSSMQRLNCLALFGAGQSRPIRETVAVASSQMTVGMALLKRPCCFLYGLCSRVHYTPPHWNTTCVNMTWFIPLHCATIDTIANGWNSH